MKVHLALFGALLSLVSAPAGAIPGRGVRTASADQLLRQGEALIMVGSFEEAARAYRQALKLRPDHSLARVRLAHCLWKGGTPGEAKKELEDLVRLPQPPTEALSLLGEIFLEEKSYPQATTILERLVDQRPSDQRAQLQLADCYRRLAEAGDAAARDKAIALFTALERAALDPLVRRACLEASLTIRYGDLGQKILEAREAITRGKEVLALRALDTLAAQNPSIPYLHYLRGMALLSPALGDRRAALAAFQRGAGHHEAALQLGVLYYEQGDLQRAVALFSAALKADPRLQEAHYHLGLVYQELGEEQKAIASLRQVLRVDTESAMARWAQTKLQLLTGQVRSLLPGQIIDPATEILIGRKTCEMIEKRWPVLRDERLEARLARIMNRVVQQSDRPRRDLRYKVAVINVAVPNALTVPSGKIYVFSGLVDLIRTRLGDRDEYYAAVIAHELAHTALRHGTGMIKAASSQGTYDSYFQLARLMGALSRTHEFEADQYGALYAYRAGYDPSAAIRLHRKMMQHRGEIPAGMSHPQHGERIARMTDYLLELRAKVRHFDRGLAALRQREFDKAVDHLEIFLGVFPDSAAARNNLAVALHRKALMHTLTAPIFRRSTDIDPHSRVQAIRLQSTDEERRSRRIEKALLREAVTEYAMVVQKDPAYPPAHSNLAAALSDLGDLRRARQHLLAALKLKPAYKEAHNNLAIVLAQQGDLTGAAAALSRAVALDARYAAAHFNLALVHEKQHRTADARRDWLAYLALDAASGWATVARARLTALR